MINYARETQFLSADVLVAGEVILHQYPGKLFTKYNVLNQQIHSLLAIQDILAINPIL